MLIILDLDCYFFIRRHSLYSYKWPKIDCLAYSIITTTCCLFKTWSVNNRVRPAWRILNRLSSAFLVSLLSPSKSKVFQSTCEVAAMWASEVRCSLDLQKTKFWIMKFAIQLSSLGSNRYWNSSHFCKSCERLTDSLESQSKSKLWTWVFGSDEFQTAPTSYSGTTCSELRSDFCLTGSWCTTCATGMWAGTGFFSKVLI